MFENSAIFRNAIILSPFNIHHYNVQDPPGKKSFWIFTSRWNKILVHGDNQ